MEQREFLAKATSVIDRATALNENARREGLLALEGELENNVCEFTGTGLRMLVDGREAGDIDKILTNMLARETDEEKRRLKAMWKDAVLLIQSGYNTRIITIWLMSHLRDDESGIFRVGWDDKLEYVESKDENALPSVLEAAITRERKKELSALVAFAQVLRDIVELTYDLSEKAQSEGFAALESAFVQENVGDVCRDSNDIDDLDDFDGGVRFKKKEPLLADNETMQKGLRMILDGAGSKELDGIFRDSLERTRSVVEQYFR